MLNYEEFKKAVKMELENQFEGDLVYSQVEKNNGMVYDGVQMKTEDSNVAPTFYLNNMYESYTDGHSIEEIVANVLQIRDRQMIEFDVSNFMEWDKVKNTIVMTLINKEKNANRLQDIAHIDYLDMIIVFRSVVDEFPSDKGIGTILIKNDFLQYWDKTVEDLYEVAKENTPKMLPPKVVDINSMQAPESGNANGIMFVVTNENFSNGASCILYDNLLKTIAETMNSDLYIIPSSIHEVLVMPADVVDVEEVKRYIPDVNGNCLETEEILSDNLYKYSLDADEVSIA